MKQFNAIEEIPGKWTVEIYDDVTEYGNLREAEYLSWKELFVWLSQKMAHGDELTIAPKW
jgi:hypothetical protein